MSDFDRLLDRIEAKLLPLSAPCQEVDCCGCFKHKAAIDWVIVLLGDLRIGCDGGWLNPVDVTESLAAALGVE